VKFLTLLVYIVASVERPPRRGGGEARAGARGGPRSGQGASWQPSTAHKLAKAREHQRRSHCDSGAGLACIVVGLACMVVGLACMVVGLACMVVGLACGAATAQRACLSRRLLAMGSMARCVPRDGLDGAVSSTRWARCSLALATLPLHHGPCTMDPAPCSIMARDASCHGT